MTTDVNRIKMVATQKENRIVVLFYEEVITSFEGKLMDRRGGGDSFVG
jgi:hypothetical protein